MNDDAKGEVSSMLIWLAHFLGNDPFEPFYVHLNFGGHIRIDFVYRVAKQLLENARMCCVSEHIVRKEKPNLGKFSV